MENWIVANEEYLTYLRQYDTHVPYSDYGTDKMKPFFGELFTVGELVYSTSIAPAAKACSYEKFIGLSENLYS